MSRYPDSWCGVKPGPSVVVVASPGRCGVGRNCLLERLQRHGWDVERLALGSVAQSLEQLRRGYRRVRDLLAYGREVLPGERLFSLQRYRLPALLWRHRNDDALDELPELPHGIRSKQTASGNGSPPARLKIRRICHEPGLLMPGITAGRWCRPPGVDGRAGRVDLAMRTQGMLSLYLGLQLLPADWQLHRPCRRQASSHRMHAALRPVSNLWELVCRR